MLTSQPLQDGGGIPALSWIRSKQRQRLIQMHAGRQDVHLPELFLPSQEGLKSLNNFSTV